jgi:hypothetical protein
MRASLPFLSLGEDIARSNPSQSTSSHGKKNQSSWPNQTNNSEKKYEDINNHAYKRSKKTQIIFMDIDLIINSNFIGSQQTHRKNSLHQIDLQEKRGEHCIENQKERRSHLATAYGPVGLWWTTHASPKEHQWGWWTPPWSCSPPAECRNRALDWMAWFWNVRRLAVWFDDSPRVSGIPEYL